jgi:cellulose synthase/poly-beta-1,6-N-acetylglucosamine synthase-like glycosyltransferase
MSTFAISLAEAAFWAAASLIVYAYIGYPVLLAIVGAFRKRQAVEPGYYPTLTVLIAAYNESANIVRKLHETLALQYPPELLEILVVSDGSTDGTDELVKSLPDPRIRLLRVEGRKGKTHAQNEGVRQSHGEIIVFSDATATYHPKALLYIAANYRDPNVGAVSGKYQYFDRDGNSPTGVGSIAFWGYENIIKFLQSRISTLTGCSGCIYSVRKRVYTPLPQSACSDLVEPLCVVRSGYRVAFESRALAYEETTRSSQEEFGMRVRVATRGMRGVLSVHQLLNPFRHPWIAFQLFSHKLLRWVVPVWLLLIFCASLALSVLPTYRYLLLLQAAFYGFALFSLLVPIHRKWNALGIPLFFITLNAAAFVGLLEMARGRRYVVWETVRK